MCCVRIDSEENEVQIFMLQFDLNGCVRRGQVWIEFCQEMSSIKSWQRLVQNKVDIAIWHLLGEDIAKVYPKAKAQRKD